MCKDGNGTNLPKIVIRNKGALYSFYQCVDYSTWGHLTTLNHLSLNLTCWQDKGKT